MATLIAYADGNLTGSTTFKTSETGTGALAMKRALNNSMTVSATLTSPTFTVTNGAVIEGVLLWPYVTTPGSAGTGTFKVDLQKGGVSQASVTVNKSDLPDANSVSVVSAINQGPPVFFKFSSTATGDGGSNWTLVFTTTAGTGSTTVSYVANSATAGDLTRALRTSTTATPAAADDLYILGELTGAATHNSRTVTMDSTAATAYGNGSVNSVSVNGGGVRVSNYATLTYGTTASTNYILRVNGDLEVYWNGTLKIGATGAEIPRSSTAVLEFQMASASGDFGLIARNNSTVNIAGLSRTSGKNVVQCKLTSDVVGTNGGGSISVTNVTNTTNAGVGADGVSVLATSLTDSVTNATHTYTIANGTSLTATTQVATVWLARGPGTNNRFVRLYMGNSSALGSITNGFFADVDLQAGTIGTCTATGNGTATSATITAVGGGYLCRMTGQVSSALANPSFLVCMCSAAGTTSFAGANNVGLYVDHMSMVTTGSLSDTTFNVDTDTGWLSGDNICIASTTRTSSEAEIFPLNAGAGASSFTSALYPFGMGGFSGSSTVQSSTHNGTAPTQAEIGLLTRNVRIRSTSTTLWGYAYFEPLATATISWTEFYYLGSNTANKHGIECKDAALGSTNPKSFSYCSSHDTYTGFYWQTAGNTSINASYSNCVIFNTSSNPFGASSTVSSSDWTFDHCLCIRGGSFWTLPSVAGTFTNNTMTSNGSSGILLNGLNIQTIGTFSGNTFHSNSGNGIAWSQTWVYGTVDSTTVWRNSSQGISFNTYLPDVTFTNLTMFGNTTANIAHSGDKLTIVGGSISSDSNANFNTAQGLSLPNLLHPITLTNVDMSGTGTGLAAHTTADFIWTGEGTPNIIANNCKFGSPTLINTKANWTASSYATFEKFNQVAGDHRCEMTYGQSRTDPTIYNAAAPSQRLTPSSAGFKLESAPKFQGVKAPVASGASLNVGVYVRKSIGSDGAAYNGNQPRLIQRANAALGQTNDVVLASFDPSWTSVVLMLGFNGANASTTITDESNSAHGNATVVGNAQLSTAVTKYGTAALTLDGSASYLTYADSADWGFGTSPFTVEGWFYFTATPTNALLIGQWSTGWRFSFESGILKLTMPGPTDGAPYTWAPTLNTWYHLCIERDNTPKLRLYINGVCVATQTASAGTNIPNGSTFEIGSLRPISVTNFDMQGYIDEVRITKGVARYATDTSFSVPTAAFPRIAAPSSGTWGKLTATSSTATDAGAWEFIVDCDGTQGWINVDDWTAA